jgi:hypothetical protein
VARRKPDPCEPGFQKRYFEAGAAVVDVVLSDPISFATT